MKKIEALIRPEKVKAVRQALEAAGCPGLTLIQVDGHGNQRGTVQKILGEEYRVGIIPKTKIEVVVHDSDARTIIDAIAAAARTGTVGDGKIFVSSIEEAVRIRTGENGDQGL